MPRNEDIAGSVEYVYIAPWSITETRLRSKKKQVGTLTECVFLERGSPFLPWLDEQKKKFLNLTVYIV